jgi:hypothetical protein
MPSRGVAARAFPAQRAAGDERLGITPRFQEDEQLVDGPSRLGLVLGGAVRASAGSLRAKSA